MKHYLFIILFLLFSGAAFGQIQRSIFNAYELEEIDQIKVNLSENETTNIEIWPGDNILVESNIAFYDGNKYTFEKLIEEGRYSLEETRASSTLTLSGNSKSTTSLNGMSEVVERTVYIPESFELTNGIYTKVEKEK